LSPLSYKEDLNFNIVSYIVDYRPT